MEIEVPSRKAALTLVSSFPPTISSAGDGGKCFGVQRNLFRLPPDRGGFGENDPLFTPYCVFHEGDGPHLFYPTHSCGHTHGSLATVGPPQNVKCQWTIDITNAAIELLQSHTVLHEETCAMEWTHRVERDDGSRQQRVAHHCPPRPKWSQSSRVPIAPKLTA